MKRLSKIAASAALAVGMALSAPAAMADGDFVNGTHWAASKKDEKLAYLLGISNLMSADYALQRRGGNARGSAIPELYEALESVSVEQAAAAIDAWYSANPDRKSEDVLSVIWLALVEK
jgi:hypothetical protein